MSEYSARSISFRPPPSCAPPSPPGPRSRARCRRCLGSRLGERPSPLVPAEAGTQSLAQNWIPASAGMSGRNQSTHVAALAVFERIVAQVDPGHRREEADRHRLALLQRHQDGVTVIGAFAMREGDALDLVALADERLERLLLLCPAI